MYSLYSAKTLGEDKVSETFRAKASAIIRHFVNLINHNTIQYNSTLDEIRVITCWVKKIRTKNWSILMSSEDTTLLLHPVMSSGGDPVSADWNGFTFSNKSQWRNH